jgi:indolepyruvate ferredoxin oxidoreductase beta subunit
MNREARPISLLIAALGGEGGGVLTNWIVSAATACDLPVQSTSIPGVAQRTGATTYYLEIFPRPFRVLDGPEPVMGLYPAPGRVDIMVASEILEAARAMESGFITPDLTTLIASTHRVYAISEKSDLADGRYNRECIRGAIEVLTREQRCADFSALAEQENTALNAVLLGLIAGTGQLPIAAESLVEAIKERGVAVDANLRGFHAGLNWKPTLDRLDDGREKPASARLADELQQRIADTFPAELTDILQVGAARALDYQDADYAALYLDRARTVLPCDSVEQAYALCRETCRYLALWMTYEDIIRVADLKTRPERYARVRAEVRAEPGEPVLISEFLKPGVDELAAVLPATLGRRLRSQRERLAWMSFSLRVGSHTVLGHRLMRLLAGCRRWRRNSLRWQEEQALIERWLNAVRETAQVSYGLALETALCANLNKGYGETFDRGRENFMRILESLIEPALDGGVEPGVAERVKSARTAALGDDTGAGLQSVLRELPVTVVNRVQPEAGYSNQSGNITNRRIA